jgi:hypothetical protein
LCCSSDSFFIACCSTDGSFLLPVEW